MEGIPMARSALLELDARVGIDGATEDGDTLILDGLPGSFGLHYQPEVDLDTDEVTGCEALLRWWHPDFGVLRPGASLHGSRWSHHLAGLDRWAVHVACRQIASWSEAGRPMRVALNLSPRSLRDPAFRRTVGEALVASGAAPTLLGIDVPLASFRMHPVATSQTAATLANFGIAIVADGVTLEIDREMLAECAVSVVKVPLANGFGGRGALHRKLPAAVDQAHGLGAVAVAKRVETPEQLAKVRAMGFDRAFGHVFGPAMDVAAVEAFADRA
jgi:EAL domain-containing protein (putative c-di-GMP-specific phosphodiesterase class I)